MVHPIIQTTPASSKAGVAKTILNFSLETTTSTQAEKHFLILPVVHMQTRSAPFNIEYLYFDFILTQKPHN